MRAESAIRRADHYKCTLKDDLKFANGHALTSERVKFSFDRNVASTTPTAPPRCWPT